MTQQSKEIFEEWVKHPMTKKFFEFCLLEAHIRRLSAGSGECSNEDVVKAGQKYMKMMYEAKVYEDIPEVEYTDLFPEEEINDNKAVSTQGTSSSG